MEMSRIGNLSIIMAQVKNWMRVLFEFALFSVNLMKGEKEIKIIFKNGDSVLTNSIDTAWSIIAYYHISKKFGVYDRTEMEEINGLSSYIKCRLEDEFYNGGIREGHPGANYSFSRTSIGIYCAIRMVKPEIVIETGVAQGISTSLFLKALQHNGLGQLISIDFPNRDPRGYTYDGVLDHVYTPKEKEPGWLVPKSLRNLWRLEIGKSSEILPTLEKCDIFYHDSEHSYNNMKYEFEWAYSHISKGGIISSDDITWNNAWTDFLNRHKDLEELLPDLFSAIAVKK